VSITVDGQTNTEGNRDTAGWSYAEPEVTLVTPRLVVPGTTIEVNGTNFGPDDAKNPIVIYLRGPKETCGGGIECENVVWVEEHASLKCDVPLGVGAGVNVIVQASDQDHSGSGTPETQVTWNTPVLLNAVALSETAGTKVTIIIIKTFL
jgi:hypothetical protein